MPDIRHSISASGAAAPCSIVIREVWPVERERQINHVWNDGGQGGVLSDVGRAMGLRRTGVERIAKAFINQPQHLRSTRRCSSRCRFDAVASVLATSINGGRKRLEGPAARFEARRRRCYLYRAAPEYRSVYKPRGYESRQQYDMKGLEHIRP